jgi:hypothetical protein
MNENILRYNSFYSYGFGLAQRYSTKIIDNTKNPTEAVIFTVNYTPIYILSFARNFDNLVFLINEFYDYSKDPIFDLPTASDVKTEERYIKGMIYNAPNIHRKVTLGYKIKESDLNFDPRNFTKKSIEVTEGGKMDTIDYIYTLDYYPALVLDATNFTRNVTTKNKKNVIVNRFGGKAGTNELKINFLGDTFDKNQVNKRKKNDRRMNMSLMEDKD